MAATLTLPADARPRPRPAPLVIEHDGVLRAGAASATFELGDHRSLLTAYLHMVRELRRAERAPTIQLRRADLDVLAAHLGTDTASVVGFLAPLMDITATQRRALLAMLASGAVVLTLAAAGLAGTNDGPGTGSNAVAVAAPSRAATATVSAAAPGTLDRFVPTAPGSAAAPVAAAATPVELHDGRPLVIIVEAPTPILSPVVVADTAPEFTVPIAPVATPGVVPIDEVAVAAPPIPVPPDAAPISAPVAEVAVGEPPVPVPPTP